MSMNEKNFKQKLLDYKKRIKEWKPSIKGTRFNKEENTMVKFVIPFFKMLGWDDLYPSKEMEFEYFVGRGIGSADIALYVDNFNLPKILVEVKPIQDIFKKKYPTKIFKYISKGKIKYGIAINGEELIFYDNYRVRHDYRRGGKLLSLKLDDFDKYNDVLLLFSKKMVKKEKGLLDKFAKEYHSRDSGFYIWRKSRKTGNSLHDEYILRLDFARNFLNKFKNIF